MPAASGTRRGWRPSRRLLAEFRRGASADRYILASVALIWVALLALLASKGVNGLRISAYASNLGLYLATLALFLSAVVLILLLRHKPDRPIHFLTRSFEASDLGARFARGAPMLLALVLFMPAFSAMKSAIPLFNAYSWDRTWIDMDYAIHGTDPWRLLNVVFGHPLITSLLSALYHLWILLIYAGGLWFCLFDKAPLLRAKYFIAYFGIWLAIGVAMATSLASVGPCFVAHFMGDHRFDEQMAYLRAANEQYPVLVLRVQDELIAWHESGSRGLGRGITAMPSMHVALAFLFFLAIRRISRQAGLIFGLFAVVILIGSVHLAYHYAVDGYVAIAVTWLIWALSGPLANAALGGNADGLSSDPVKSQNFEH